MKVSVPALVATHLAVAGMTYGLTDRRPIDVDVKYDGLFKITTSKILATTVESLRNENRLLVFSYKGNAKVKADTHWLWVFAGTQELSVPAVVSYYVDLSTLTLADLTYDEKTEIVRVWLPRVTLGDIAFQPENATTINGGLLTFSEAQVEELRKLNYANARRAMIAQAQGKGLLQSAQQQANTNIGSLFEIPLRMAGKPHVKVLAGFR